MCNSNREIYDMPIDVTVFSARFRLFRLYRNSAINY